jgi:arabinose-5-phosphate isomerase
MIQDFRRPDSSGSASEPADIRVARRVLGIEAEALVAMAGSLEHNFVAAIDQMLAAKGRIIVSGMGKSGHVARKIAATLASTGTPAQFVHPAEASHGDLGMIGAGDVMLVLSNSGETPELADLISHAARFGIPLIGIASRPGSALLMAASVALCLPPAPEACAIGLAPTTSTTMMLALGDAIAVALMERRGFSPEDYKVLHPGGQLGKRLSRVADIMRAGPDLPLIAPDCNLQDLLLVMSEGGLGCAGVVDANGLVIGGVSDGDIRRHFAQSKSPEARARDLMTPSPKAIRQSALAVEAVQVMSTTGRGISWLFVVDDASDGVSGPYKPVGIIHLKDCLRVGIA